MYRAALLAVTLAALGTLILGGEPETTLLMASAVVSGLLCFDTSMEGQLHSRWPWVLVSLAPILKTVPLVWFELKANDGLLIERYDHAGSLLFGVCLFGAAVMLARPSETLGSDIAVFDATTIVGTAMTAAAAGASVAFLFDRNFGSTTAGRLLETPTWFVIGGLLAATALAAGHAREISRSLAALLVTNALVAGLLAFTVAGRTVDRGWWALVFAGLALSAAAFGPGALGARSRRDRRSNVAVVICLVVGAIAAAAAISARSNPASWAPGWAILGVLSLSMFALAMASRPIDEQARGTDALLDSQDIGVPGSSARVDLRADIQAKEEALRSLRRSAEISGQKAPLADAAAGAEGAAGSGVVVAAAEPVARVRVEGAVVEAAESVARVPPTRPEGTNAEAASAPPVSRVQERRRAAWRRSSAKAVKAEAAPAAADVESAAEPAATAGAEAESAAEPAGTMGAEVESAAGPAGTVSTEVESAAGPAGTMSAEAESAAESAAGPEGTVSAEVESAPRPLTAAEDADAEQDLAAFSDSNLIAAARAAAEVRDAPREQRHAKAPLAQAHHFDPSTGLLSAAGLQHALGIAFATHRRAGHVTIMMFTIRDLDDIEREHGRLASAAVTREVAERLRSLLPAGTGARFARAAYAVVFLGDLGPTGDTVQRLARVLLHLRAPVEGGAVGDKIDVVAGMAQCYEGEPVATFVQRANQGLARAVQTAEPTFVAMP